MVLPQADHLCWRSRTTRPLAALSRLLERQGFSPASATTVSGAIHASEQHSLDAVILDLLLDGHESGVEFLAWLRQQRRYERTPGLIYTVMTMLERRGRIDSSLPRARLLRAPSHDATRGLPAAVDWWDRLGVTTP